MKVTLFSSNQPRHINPSKELGKIADEVFYIAEVNTVFPGEVADFFNKSEVMQRYFKNVIRSERKFLVILDFSRVMFTLSIKWRFESFRPRATK